MRLIYKSGWYKALSVCRFLLARARYGSRFTCPELSMIGSRCGVHVFRQGKIECRGRIILDDQVLLFAKGEISIGRQFCVNRYSRIVAHEKIEIGDHVTIGQSVAILDHDHHYTMLDGRLKLDGYRTAPIKIGNNIWIGDKCTILRGVSIGDNVVVGANTLIHKDVPSGVVIGGVPFKVLKQLS